MRTYMWVLGMRPWCPSTGNKHRACWNDEGRLYFGRSPSPCFVRRLPLWNGSDSSSISERHIGHPRVRILVMVHALQIFSSFDNVVERDGLCLESHSVNRRRPASILRMRRDLGMHYCRTGTRDNAGVEDAGWIGPPIVLGKEPRTILNNVNMRRGRQKPRRE